MRYPAAKRKPLGGVGAEIRAFQRLVVRVGLGLDGQCVAVRGHGLCAQGFVRIGHGHFGRHCAAHKVPHGHLRHLSGVFVQNEQGRLRVVCGAGAGLRRGWRLRTVRDRRRGGGRCGSCTGAAFFVFPGWKKQRGQRQNINEHGEQEHKRQYLFHQRSLRFLLLCVLFRGGCPPRTRTGRGAAFPQWPPQQRLQTLC